jgi:hypothetical protein
MGLGLGGNVFDETFAFYFQDTFSSEESFAGGV